MLYAYIVQHLFIDTQHGDSVKLRSLYVVDIRYTFSDDGTSHRR